MVHPIEFWVSHNLAAVPHKWLLQLALSGDFKTVVQNIDENYT